ncbi:protein phosphatase PP2A-like protein [Dinothrombium tinctorium]|uniref:Protein phosphatase PP2A-like protein n=1 Tax=Dinothrombium tinctorium TaxID=1965070 RepID=A0A3S3QQ01_9ACAR|nr:protein phosphatase PP2A-like protein [Dinothrombium tinctorium]
MRNKVILYKRSPKEEQQQHRGSSKSSISIDEERIPHPSDYCYVVTTVNSYSNIVVDSTNLKCIHSLHSCDTCLLRSASSKCNVIHYGVCLPLTSKEELIVSSFKLSNTSIDYDDDNEGDYAESSTSSQVLTSCSSDLSSDSDIEIKTATKPANKSSRTKSPSKPSSPTLSDCATIKLLAEDVEGKLESLLNTFVTEEKLRQEARLNLLNKRSSSLSSLNSSDSGSVLSSPTTSPKSPNFFNDARQHLNTSNTGACVLDRQRSMSPSRQSIGTSISRQRNVSPSRQRSNSPSTVPTDAKTAPGTAATATSASSLSSATTAKMNGDCAKNFDNKNISPIKKCGEKSEKQIVSSSKSSQSSTKFSSNNQANSDLNLNKMVFGLHEKTPKSKYMQIVSERQSCSSSSKAECPTTICKLTRENNDDNNSINATNRTNMREDKNKNCLVTNDRHSSLQNSDECSKTMEQILAEALQLTDDENSNRCTLANDTNDKHQQQQMTINPKLLKLMERHSERHSSDDSNRGEKSPDYNFSSPVDYAKSRFISISKVKNTHNIYKDLIGEKTPTQTLVNEARIKWENNAFANGLSSKKLSANYYFNSLNFLNNREQTTGIRGLQNGHHPSHHHSSSHQTRHSPITPFLTQGSVAERVLLFEKRPEVVHRESENGKGVKRTASSSNIKSAALHSAAWKANDKNESEVANVARNFGQLSARKLSALSRGGAGLTIPRFYFPNGRPLSSTEVDAQIRSIVAEFAKFENGVAKKEDFGRLAKVCGLPLYWKAPLYLSVSGNEKTKTITCDAFVEYWKKLSIASFDEASKFVKILTKSKRNYLIPEDFIPMLQDVIDTHPGLTFLKDAIEFHMRYINTVIARIYYCVNQSWSGRITVSELRKSNFLSVLALLEDEEDINQITDYFSYEHFYVIYCKFWELDKDHDLIIDKYDLSRHNDGAISSRMINRIFSGAVTQGPARKQSKMTYFEFVWFLLAEEDKKHPRSIEYWFRCMDIDGDGYLSMYELEYFYDEQMRRMEAIGIEPLPFNDCLCQMLDMIRPKVNCKISLADLKNCRLSYIFFDTFFNLDKYLDYEQRDPFANKDQDDSLVSDWDRFAAEEYEILVAEESVNNQ